MAVEDAAAVEVVVAMGVEDTLAVAEAATLVGEAAAVVTAGRAV